MEQLSSLAFLLALVGGAHDLATRRIPNWLTFTAMLLGLAARAWLGGAAGGLDALLGLSLGFALFFPMYLFGYMGAGDVKLLMAVGAFTGWQICFRTAVASILVGAVFALGEVAYRGRLLAVAKNTYQFLRSLLVPGLVAERLKVDESRKFAFGICIAAGLAAVLFLQHQGALS